MVLLLAVHVGLGALDPTTGASFPETRDARIRPSLTSSPTTPATPPSVPTSAPTTTAADPAPRSSSPTGPSPTRVSSARLLALLDGVRVVPARPNPPGYDRGCSPGEGCVFGTEWNDATSAPAGRNGCDTRNDVLRQDLHDVELDPRTNGCVVRRGTLADPYTGRVIAFERGYGTSLAVQIDHLIPLAAAWDFGAAEWSQARRESFANDVRYELLAVDGQANQEKSDSTPADWLPPNRAFHCEYGIRYLTAARRWELAISKADRAALTDVVEQDCPA